MALTIPEIFFKEWFWLSLMAVIIVIHYFFGKTPLQPKPSKFSTKHKNTIRKITDIGIICFVLAGFYFILSYPIRELLESANIPKEIQTTSLHFAWSWLLISLTIVSGSSGSLIGLLSVFEKNLTRCKRVFLLGLCLLPIAFTALELLTGMVETNWTTIQICIYSSIGSWIVNAPAIFIGKHFFPVSWNIMRKLHLVSGDYSG